MSTRITLLLAALMLALPAGCRRAEVDPYETYLPGDLDAMPRTPMTLTPAGALEPNVGTLRAIAIDGSDRIYVCGSAGVRVMGPDGGPLGAWTPPGDAWAIAVGGDGVVYVGLAARVIKYDATGKELGSWAIDAARPGHPPRITSIAVHGDSVFVADAGQLCIHRYAFTGDFMNDIGKRDDARGFVGIIAPSPYVDVAVDNEGRLVVGNPGRLRVETYTVGGEYLEPLTWGGPGLAPERFSGCCNPTNLALTREGWVVTSEKGLPRVKVSDRAGRLIAYLPPSTFSPRDAGIDLAVDSKNRIYIARPSTGKILIYELKPAKEAP